MKVIRKNPADDKDKRVLLGAPLDCYRRSKKWKRIVIWIRIVFNYFPLLDNSVKVWRKTAKTCDKVRKSYQYRSSFKCQNKWYKNQRYPFGKTQTYWVWDFTDFSYYLVWILVAQTNRVPSLVLSVKDIFRKSVSENKIKVKL